MKTLISSDFKLYLNKYWRAHLAVMTNHQTLKATTLKANKITVGAGLDEADFSQESLKRAKM